MDQPGRLFFMSYQVLARKYRPQAFAQVVGQDHITKTLQNALAAGRLHHAYLFVGVRGTGKTTVARILARALNCAHREGPEPCGECGPCREIAAGASLDVQEIDGASNTGVDDVRELRERTKYLPSSGRYKIYIIDEVHMLSTSAFNALLKTLEEPPAHVVFIFATTEAHKIPATILSRCQRYDFRRIPPAMIAATLARIAGSEGAPVEEGALSLIAREATGSLRDAESLFDQAIAFSGGAVTADTIKAMLGFLDRKRLFDLLEALATRDAARALGVLDEVFLTGADLNRFAQDLLELIRHLLVLSECGDERGAVDLLLDEIGILKGLVARDDPPATEASAGRSATQASAGRSATQASAGRSATQASADRSATQASADRSPFGGPELHQMFSLWYRVADDVARSPFPKMLLEVGLIRLCRVGPVRPIEEIVARIETIIEAGDQRPVTGDQRSVSRDQRPETGDRSPVSGHRSPVTDVAAGRRSRLPAEARVAGVTAHEPTFEAVVSPADVDAERRWQEFMRKIAGERPSVASIFQHGVLVGIDDGVVKVMFDNPHYADLLSEEERKAQVESLFQSFFGRPMRLAVGRGGEAPSPGAKGERKKELMREALGSDIVRQAADILGAQLHDVKVEGEKR